MANITGTAGNDFRYGTNSNDIIDMLDGNDSVVAGGGNDYVSLGNGNDYVRLDVGRDTIDAGAGNDEVVLGADGGEVYAWDGDDTIRGGIGSDLVNGGAGNDLIQTGTGGVDEQVFADSGNDTIEVGLVQSGYYSAGSGNDTVRLLAGTRGSIFGPIPLEYHGNDGNDLLDVGATVRFINGGLVVSGAIVDLKNGYVSTGLGFAKISGFEMLQTSFANDTIIGSDGADSIWSGDGADSVNGGLGNDFINGEAGNDTLSGEDGNDIIYAGNGNDSVLGGAGDDYLLSGSGKDTMKGGLGNDVLNAISMTGGTVMGETGADYIYLSQSSTTELATYDGGTGNDTMVTGLSVQMSSDYYGGSGTDTFDARAVQTGMNVLLAVAGTVNGRTMIGFEKVITGIGSDIVSVNRTGASVETRDGNDLVEVQSGGVGAFDGGNGFDVISLGLQTTGVNLNLNRGTLTTNAGSSTVKGFEYAYGTIANDSLTGDGSANQFFASAGNDYMSGGTGNDTLWGEDGNDEIYAGSDDDVVYGAFGDDTIYAGAGVDYLAGGDGNDFLVGGSTAGNQQDSLLGGAGNDKLYAISGGAFLDGDIGDDTLSGGSGNDDLYGGEGNDSISTGGGTYNYAQGGEGNDTINASSSVSGDIMGQQGNDLILLSAVAGGLTFYDGGTGDDTFRTGATLGGLAQISGDDGYDRLNAGELSIDLTVYLDNGGTLNGMDMHSIESVWTGSGTDTVTVAIAGAEVRTYAGWDLVTLLDGATGTFDAGEDIDTLDLGQVTGDVTANLRNGAVTTAAGASTARNFEDVYSGAGNDSLTGTDASNTFSSGAGNDTIRAGGSSDWVYSSGGDDSVDGGAGDDYIYLNDGNDSAFGGTGNDALYGGAGVDTLNGGAGNDFIFGGDGADNLYGGADADTFLFYNKTDSGPGSRADMIRDFQSGVDFIDLSALGDLTYIGTGAFTKQAGEVHYLVSGNTTTIEVDLNGDGTRDMQIRLTGLTSGLTESDFILT